MHVYRFAMGTTDIVKLYNNFDHGPLLYYCMHNNNAICHKYNVQSCILNHRMETYIKTIAEYGT